MEDESSSVSCAICMGDVQQPGRQAVATACGVFYLTFVKIVRHSDVS
jgi:hypothetical protein